MTALIARWRASNTYHQTQTFPDHLPQLFQLSAFQIFPRSPFILLRMFDLETLLQCFHWLFYGQDSSFAWLYGQDSSFAWL